MATEARVVRGPHRFCVNRMTGVTDVFNYLDIAKLTDTLGKGSFLFRIVRCFPNFVSRGRV